MRAWEALEEHVSPWVSPILSKLCGDEYNFAVKSVGCVTSEPGAPEQHFHADGRIFGIFNVFINTAKVETIDGPTEFIHGSHEWDHDAAHVTTPERKAHDSAPRTQPELLLPGSVLIYDYRVMHKGGANDSMRRRSLAYVMFCSRSARDSWNFPLDDSIWDSDRTSDGDGE
jgi:ectoine hydroxylase-related dioxygenase (phytanoyl-CoA dioxygenase family)